MDDNTVLVWSKGDEESNEVLRNAIRSVKYKWAYLKVEHARWHLLRTRPIRAPFQTGVPYITNGEVFWK